MSERVPTPTSDDEDDSIELLDFDLAESGDENSGADQSSKEIGGVLLELELSTKAPSLRDISSDREFLHELISGQGEQQSDDGRESPENSTTGELELGQPSAEHVLGVHLGDHESLAAALAVESDGHKSLQMLRGDGQATTFGAEMHWVEAALRRKKEEADKQLSVATGQGGNWTGVVVRRATLAVPPTASMQFKRRTLHFAQKAGLSEAQLVSQPLAVAAGFVSQGHRWDWRRLLVLDACPDTLCASLVALEDAAHFRVLGTDRERYANNDTQLALHSPPTCPLEWSEDGEELVNGAMRRLLRRNEWLNPGGESEAFRLDSVLVTGNWGGRLAQVLPPPHFEQRRPPVVTTLGVLDAARMAAEGAALIGVWRLRQTNGNGGAPSAQDVLPFAVECLYAEADSRHTLFERHTEFPCERRINFFTALDRQRQFRFEFFEEIGTDGIAELPATEVLCVGGLDEAKAGAVSVELHLRIDHNGLFHVHAESCARRLA